MFFMQYTTPFPCLFHKAVEMFHYWRNNSTAFPPSAEHHSIKETPLLGYWHQHLFFPLSFSVEEQWCFCKSLLVS